MIRNGLLEEAQADGTIKTWVRSLRKHDFGLGQGGICVYISKVEQKGTRFAKCMKKSEPAQPRGTPVRTVPAQVWAETQLHTEQRERVPCAGSRCGSTGCWQVANTPRSWRGFQPLSPLTRCEWQTLFLISAQDPFNIFWAYTTLPGCTQLAWFL